MKREFSKLGTEASIKNTLPPVNDDNGNKQAIVPYKSRSGSVEILPQEEYEFEVSSSGKAIYYMKQERENLKTIGLYEDKEPTPPQPSENELKVVNNSSVTFRFRVKDVGISIPVESGKSIDIELTDVYGNPAKISANYAIEVSASFTGKYREEEVDTQLYVDVQDDSTYIGDPKGGEQDWHFRYGDFGILTID